MAAALVAVGAGSAAAATPQQIYRDLADNNRLDRKYSARDIDRAFSNPSITGYTRPSRVARTPQVRAVPAPAAGTTGGGRSVPFSGLDLAMFVLVGVPLLALGAGMRRVGGRVRTTELT